MKKLTKKLSTIYDEVEDFYDGFAVVRRKWKWGLVNKKGEEVVTCQYDNVVTGPFFDGLAKVELDGKWGSDERPCP